MADYLKNSTAKPLLSYLDGSVPRQLAAHFGNHLQGLPKHHKFEIIIMIATVGNHDTNPEFEESWGNYSLQQACNEVGIFLSLHDYGIPLIQVLDSLIWDEQLALCQFLIDNLRHNQHPTGGATYTT